MAIGLGQILVLDLLGQRAQALLEAGFFLRRVERLQVVLALEQHFDEGTRLGQGFAQRQGAFFAQDLVGILAALDQTNLERPAGLKLGQGTIQRPESGALSGLVAIETQGRFWVTAP